MAFGGPTVRTAKNPYAIASDSFSIRLPPDVAGGVFDGLGASQLAARGARGGFWVHPSFDLVVGGAVQVIP
jgi:hypothetical protein